MKIMFVKAKSNIDLLPVVEKALPLLGEKIGLITTVQHLHKIKEVKEFLKKNMKKVIMGGQILGCNLKNAERIMNKVDCFLYIGTGRFHPFGALLHTKKRIICADPLTNSVTMIDEKYFEAVEKNRRIAYMKFLHADNIGVIISTKPGQFNLANARSLEKKYKDKNFYYFVCDSINLEELDNFPFIQCWINTACPRIEDDFENSKKPIINLIELPQNI